MRPPRKPVTGNEQKSVKPRVRKLLDKHGWFWWGTPATMYSTAGIADILAVKSGMFLAIETKFGDNDPTPTQVAFLNSVRACDHFAFVVRETTLDALATFLRTLDESVAYATRNEVAPPEIGGPMLDAIKEMGDKEILKPDRFAKLSKVHALRSKP